MSVLEMPKTNDCPEAAMDTELREKFDDLHQRIVHLLDSL
jgi:hypothetical protein